MPITVLTGETASITSGVTTITDLVSQVWTLMTSNSACYGFCRCIAPRRCNWRYQKAYT